MNLVSCRCTNCGANMQVDESKDTAVCSFCGSTFLVEKPTDLNELNEQAMERFVGMMMDFEIQKGVLVKYNGKSEKVIIPNGVKQIKDAFKGCTGLKSVVIPDSVTNIGNAAFYGCTSLTDIRIPESVTNLGAYAFEGCKSLKEITIPSGVTLIRLGTFIGCTSLTSITIPNGVMRIGDEAFRGCTGLTSVTMPDSVRELGSSVFGGCSALDSFSASPEWIKRNYQIHPCLAKYLPKNEREQETRSSGGCYVATAVYGSYDCPQVWVLRRYRDDILSATWGGRLFIRAYYATSPTLVRLFGKKAWFQSLWRGRLDQMVLRLKNRGLEDTPYQDKPW